MLVTYWGEPERMHVYVCLLACLSVATYCKLNETEIFWFISCNIVPVWLKQVAVISKKKNIHSTKTTQVEMTRFCIFCTLSDNILCWPGCMGWNKVYPLGVILPVMNTWWVGQQKPTGRGCLWISLVKSTYLWAVKSFLYLSLWLHSLQKRQRVRAMLISHQIPHFVDFLYWSWIP